MRILLAEDDKHLNQSLTRHLISKGYDVDTCLDGEDALYYAKQNIHDVILLDRMLPYINGTQVLNSILNEHIYIPVIIITALGSLQDKVAGLELGADDYLVKPFAFEELLARIHSVTRRSPILHMSNLLQLKDIAYNEDNNVLTGPAGACSLSSRESTLLKIFLRNPEQILSRSTLLLKVWGPESDVEEGNLDNYIHFLRRRLKTVNSSLIIRTVRGIGYLLTAKGASD